MISRLFVSQYKCLVNFELKLSQIQLLTGRNGSGKTTVFDALESLQKIIAGDSVPSIEFPTASSLTAWLNDPIQRFEVDVEGNGGHYRYSLELTHNRSQLKGVVSRESVVFDGRALLDFDGKTVKLLSGANGEETSYRQNGNVSPLSIVPDSSATSELLWLKQRLGSSIHVYSPDAPRIGKDFLEQTKAGRKLNNLLEWLSYESVVNNVGYDKYVDYLVDQVIIGLIAIKRLLITPGRREFQYWFDASPFEPGAAQGYDLTLDQLSDGQRMLIAIYAIAILMAKPGSTICIEEPDNYLGLNEIQPWLAFLLDILDQRQCQCLLISHHPEAFNYLAPDYGIWFERDDAREVRCAPFNEAGNPHLTPAELVARGWR